MAAPATVGCQHAINATVIDGALQLAAGTRLQTLPANLRRQFQIQDYASQLITRNLTGTTVWDACAGNGGKTLALANQLPNARIFASDIRSHALQKLRHRAQQAQFHNITTATLDATTQRPGQRFDCVLLDVPCTGSGIWRRSPDTQWRKPLNADLLQLQSNIMNNTAQAVNPGGSLLYTSCSWLPQENEHQIARFLSQQPDFTLEHQQLYGNPEADADSLFSATLRRAECR